MVALLPVTIDLPRGRVVVHDSRGFFTQYPIAQVDLPSSRKPAVKMEVSAKSFWKDGRPVVANGASAKDAMPRIDLGRAGYALYGVEETSNNAESEIDLQNDGAGSGSPDPKRSPQGIAMLKDDISQLEVLIRKGTPVTIIHDEKKEP